MNSSWIPNAWGASDWGLAVGLLLAVTAGIVIWSYFNARAAAGSKSLMGANEDFGCVVTGGLFTRAHVSLCSPGKGSEFNGGHGR